MIPIGVLQAGSEMEDDPVVGLIIGVAFVIFAVIWLIREKFFVRAWVFSDWAIMILALAAAIIIVSVRTLIWGDNPPKWLNPVAYVLLGVACVAFVITGFISLKRSDGIENEDQDLEGPAR